jgi:hypothetical protein
MHKHVQTFVTIHVVSWAKLNLKNPIAFSQTNAYKHYTVKGALCKEVVTVVGEN